MYRPTPGILSTNSHISRPDRGRLLAGLCALVLPSASCHESASTNARAPQEHVAITAVTSARPLEANADDLAVLAEDGIVLTGHTSNGQDILPSAILTPEQARGHYHVRLERKGGKSLREDVFSGAGRKIEHTEIERLANGTIRYHVFNAHEIETTTIEISASGRETRRSRSGARESRDGCAAFQHRFNRRGRIIESLCLDRNDNPVVNTDGCEMLRFVWDQRGVRVRQSCHDARGAPSTFVQGGHAMRGEYNVFADRIKTTYVDANENPVATRDGCWGNKQVFDVRGNTTLEACLGRNTRPQNARGNDFAAMEAVYDENDCVIRHRWLNSEGERVDILDIHEIAYSRNATCDLVAQELRSRSGNLAHGDRLSTPSLENRLDAQGQVIERRCFDASSDPTSCDSPGRASTPTLGVMVRFTYDERGRVTSSKYFDAKGAPSRKSNEFPHEERLAWNDEGRTTRRTYHDEKGNPALALLVARHDYFYDDMGFELGEKNLGLTGEPVLSKLGYHERRVLRDMQHRRVRIELRGIDDNLVETSGMLSEGVSWPKGAAFVSIERGKSSTNTFYDRNSRELRRLDCTRVESHCHE